MTETQLPESHNNEQERVQLQIAIEAATQQLEALKSQIHAFEDVLRLHLTDYIIETQELTALYKAQKRAKKDKRLEQKRRGKNYKAPTGITTIKENTDKTVILDSDTEQLKKRLYREAMLQVHPDKFSLKPLEADAANDLTTQLISIYKTGSLEELKAFHTYIFTDQSDIKIAMEHKTTVTLTTETLAHLKQSLNKLESELQALKQSHLNHILTTYPNPLIFVDELKAYYKDKIEKLKKRTRSKS